MNLTKEKILTGIIAPFVKALAYALSFIKDQTLVKEIIAEAAEQITALSVEMETPTQEEAVYSLLDIADTIAEATDVKWDETAVDAVRAGTDFVFKRGQGVVNFFKLLFLRRKAKKEAAAEADANKK